VEGYGDRLTGSRFSPDVERRVPLQNRMVGKQTCQPNLSLCAHREQTYGGEGNYSKVHT
jgi:hypothetical protein